MVRNLSSAGASLSGYSYFYDAPNHRDVRSGMQWQFANEVIRQVRYGYDATDQLTSENAYNGPADYNHTQNFAYDAMGNRTSHQSTRNGTTTRTTPSHNRLNQMVSASSQNSGASQARTWSGNDYDASGNLTLSRGVDGSRTLYSYDDLDRLNRVEWKSAGGTSTKKIEWVYDFANRKSVEREFTWSNGTWVQSGFKKRIYSGMDVVIGFEIGALAAL